MEERIFLKDENFLVVYKQQNEPMAVCTGLVKNYLGGKNLKPIYELETLACGPVVYALNKKTFDVLSALYKNKEFDFKFYAVTVGQPKQDSGTFSAYVTMDKKENKLIHIPQLNAGVENFGIIFHTLQKIQQIQLVKIEVNEILPETIRFAMADLNMPIFGDKAYNGDILAKNTNTALCLVDIRFKHPFKEEFLSFRAMVPETKPWNYFDLNKIFKLKIGG